MVKDDVMQVITLPKKCHYIRDSNNKSLIKIQFSMVGNIAFADMYVIDNGTEVNIVSVNLGADINGPIYLFSNFIHSLYIKSIGDTNLLYQYGHDVMEIIKANNHISNFKLLYSNSNGNVYNVSYTIECYLRDRAIINTQISLKNGNKIDLFIHASRIYNNSFPSSYDNILNTEISLSSYRYKVIKSEDEPVLLFEAIVIGDKINFHLMPIIWCKDISTGKYLYICAHLYLIDISIETNKINDIDNYWDILLDWIDIKCLEYDCRIYVKGVESIKMEWLHDESILITVNDNRFKQYEIEISSVYIDESVYIKYNLKSDIDEYALNAGVDATVYGIPLRNLKIKTQEEE